MESEMTTAEMVEVLRGAASIACDDWPDRFSAIADRLEALDAERIKWVSLHQLAHMTNLPTAWLRRSANDGTIPHIMAANRMMFNVAMVDAALKALQAGVAAAHDAARKEAGL